MNPRNLRIAAAAAAAGFLLAVPAAQAAAKPQTPEARAQEAAAQGPDQLRRFIQRTRMVYGLYFHDFVKAGR